MSERASISRAGSTFIGDNLVKWEDDDVRAPDTLLIEASCRCCTQHKIVKEFTNNVGIFRVEYVYSYTEITPKRITDVYKNVYAYMIVKFVTVTRTMLMSIDDYDS